MAIQESFPEPLVFAPVSAVHRHTIILLHGRGNRADTFSKLFLGSRVPNPPPSDRRSGHNAAPVGGGPAPLPAAATFREAFPDAKFVFPWARRQRATVYRRSIVRQWFDDWHLGSRLAGPAVDARYDEGLQTTGLGETVAYLHGLVAAEAALVGGGARNVVLGGISQGGAAGLVAALLWDGAERLGAVVGICTWLPYMRQMTDALGSPGFCSGSEEGEDGCFDPFGPSPAPDDEGAERQPVARVLEWLREEIERPADRGSSWREGPRSTMPAILCHGAEDDRVHAERSRRASEVLPGLGLDPVLWRAYPGVGHELSEDMLADIAAFLTRALGPRTTEAGTAPAGEVCG